MDYATHERQQKRAAVAAQAWTTRAQLDEPELKIVGRIYYSEELNGWQMQPSHVLTVKGWMEMAPLDLFGYQLVSTVDKDGNVTLPF